MVTLSPGEDSAFASIGEGVVIELRSEEGLQVASTFKLAASAALREEIDAGRRAWGDVVTLRDEWRSLPTGRLRDWPAGARLTLHTLAALIISDREPRIKPSW